MKPRSILLSLLATAALAACGGGTSGAGGATEQTTALSAETASITATTVPTAEATTQTTLDTVAADDLRARLRIAGEINGKELDTLATLVESEKAGSGAGARATSERTVYRFWRPTQGTHFYTASSSERDQIMADLPGFLYEGAVFVAHADAAMGLVPVYRFHNTVSGSHFYTASESEKNYVQTHIPELRLEGVAYYAAAQAAKGFVPAFRFFNANKLSHFYTRSEDERDRLIAAGGDYSYEGVAYYVLPSNDTSAPVLAEVFPAAGESVPTTITHVSGKVGDNVAVKSVSLRIGATEVPAILQAGAFSASLPLVAGHNSYTIVAEDYAGNRLESPASVYLGSRAAGGGSHSGAIRNSLLYTVGRNNTGQLGFGNTSVLADGEAAHPTSMRQIGHGAQTPVSVMFNQNFSLMLDSAGTVWAWGTNASGQLGQGSCSETMVTDDQWVPSPVNGLTSVQTVAAGYDHSLALKSDGTVWAFGKNNLGQLGDGSTTNRDCAVQVQGCRRMRPSSRWPQARKGLMRWTTRVGSGHGAATSTATWGRARSAAPVRRRPHRFGCPSTRRSSCSPPGGIMCWR
ncbi:MAG: hypothetical protein R3E42_15305 [Burkholderiaceae bacterium]